MCMLPNAIYKTCWFTHRSGLEFHGCGSSHCFPRAMSAARAQVLIKPKTILHASVIFSNGCKDRTRSATAALEHPKTRTARRWLANIVLIILEYSLQVWRKGAWLSYLAVLFKWGVAQCISVLTNTMGAGYIHTDCLRNKYDLVNWLEIAIIEGEDTYTAEK